MGALSPKVVAFEGPWQHQMLHTRGVRLHAATMGNPSDPLIVLLHDAYGGWFDYRSMLPVLADAGFHVAALDSRGYGMSDKPPAGYDLHNATGDIAGAIRTLGHRDAHVVGVGSGAAIAWALATSHPDHVASIITAGAVHPGDMRKAILHRPWLYTGLVGITLPLRMPPALRKLYWHNPKARIARELRLNTHPSFQASERFDEEVRLRTVACGISSTFPGIAKTMRYQVNLPPLAWLNAPVQAPAFALEGSAQSQIEQRFAAMRTVSGIRTFQLQQVRHRPHLEAPEEFARVVLDSVRSVIS